MNNCGRICVYYFIDARLRDQAIIQRAEVGQGTLQFGKFVSNVDILYQPEPVSQNRCSVLAYSFAEHSNLLNVVPHKKVSRD